MSNINITFIVILLGIIVFFLWQEQGIQKAKDSMKNVYNSKINLIAYIGSIIMLLLIFFVKYFYINNSFQNRFTHFHILGIFTIMIGSFDFVITLNITNNLKTTSKRTYYIIPTLLVVSGVILLLIRYISFMGKALGHDEVFYLLWTLIFIGTVLTGQKWDKNSGICPSK